MTQAKAVDVARVCLCADRTALSMRRTQGLSGRKILHSAAALSSKGTVHALSVRRGRSAGARGDASGSGTARSKS